MTDRDTTPGGQFLRPFLGWLSFPAEVFLRRHFGMRYMSWWLGIQAYAAFRFATFLFAIGSMMMGGLSPAALFGYGFFGGGGALSTALQNGMSSLLYNAFLYVWVGLFLFHRYEIWQRRKLPWHSFSYGVSWLSYIPWNRWLRLPWIGAYLKVDEYTIFCVMEPMLVLVIALLLKRIDPVVGNYLILSAASLFAKSHLMYYRDQGRILDMMDARIESAFLQKSMMGAPRQQTAGWSVATPPPALDLPAEPAPMNIAATVNETMGQQLSLLKDE